MPTPRSWILVTAAALALSCSGSKSSTGSPGSGGATASGGSPGAGGSPGSGGSLGTGGAKSTGGSPGSGGSVGSGGALGGGGSIDAGPDATVAGADAAGGSGDGGEACNPGGGPRHPFGGHSFTYTNGSIRPSGTQQSLDATTTAFYTSWKAARLVNGCGGSYVSFGGKGKDPLFVSEGHGYGMLIAVLMAGFDPGARAIFDGFYDVFRKYPSINNADLMGWAVLKGCALSSAANDLPDSATDGDLDIAFALLLADKQWGSCGRINYLAEARKVIAAIKAHTVNQTTHLMLLGDWADINAPYYAARYASATGPFGMPHSRYYWGTRPSDYMMDHFKAFGAASADSGWTTIVDAHYGLIAAIAPKATGLMPDFVEKTDTMPAPAAPNYLEDVTDGDYAYNACRVPWRLGIDYLATGDARAKATLDAINAWIQGKTGNDPTKIVDGYKLDGTAIGSGGSFAFEAPFGVAAMAGPSNQAWLDAIWKHMAVQNPTANVGYFEDTLKLLAMIAMSGNWWQP